VRTRREVPGRDPLAIRDVGGPEIAKALEDLFATDGALLHQHRQEPCEALGSSDPRALRCGGS